ncbi:MAG TPA: hypothetical protein VI233_05340, partial [Puia sp.]
RRSDYGIGHSPHLRVMHRYLFLLTGFLSAFSAFSQKVILDERFDRWMSSRLYAVDSYRPHEKVSLNIFSDRPEDKDEYVDMLCSEGDGKHGFYVSLKVYDKDGTKTDMMVIRLDTPVQKGMAYTVQMDAIYPESINYHIDSIQAVFLKEEKDVVSWVVGGRWSGQYALFSLQGVGNANWAKVESSFVAEGDYKYVMIGNLESDDNTRALRENDCNCCPRDRKEKEHKWYSQLLIDNILIKPGGGI